MNFVVCSDAFVLFSDENYKVETLSKGLYEITMKLIIKSVREQDFGSFRCVATNSLGETDGKIKLYSEWLFINFRYSKKNFTFISQYLLHIKKIGMLREKKTSFYQDTIYDIKNIKFSEYTIILIERIIILSRFFNSCTVLFTCARFLIENCMY